MKRIRSYRENAINRKNKKTIILYFFLTFLLIIVFLLFGLKLIVKFTLFVTDFKKDTKQVDVNDTTPPPPPKFDVNIDSTNKSRFDLRGSTESGINVEIYHNQEMSEILSDKQGKFQINIDLVEGENEFYGISIDNSKNKSQPSDKFTLIYDKTPPKLEVLKPKSNDAFYGSKQRQITIEGQTDPNTNLTINDRFVLVDSDGNFAFTSSLVEGENTFKLKAIDDAGNQAESSIILNYYP